MSPDTEARRASNNLPQEECQLTLIDKSGRSMPKVQHKRKRIDREDEAKHADSNHVAATAEVPSVKREFILTKSTDEALEDVVQAFSRATGAKLTNSHFLRALMKGLAHAMPELEREASQIGELKRPGNARGKEAERDEYEETLAEAVVSALRSCPPFEAGKKRSSKGK